MPSTPVVWTINHAYALSVYDIYDMRGSSYNEGATYFTKRNPIMTYDSIGAQFKGYNSPQGTSIISTSLIETNPDDNSKYVVGYVYDESAKGYHVWRKRPYTEGENINSWEGTSYDQYMSYEIGATVNSSGTFTVNNNENLTTEDAAYEYFEASTGYDLSVADVTNFETTWSQETDGSEFFNSRAILGVFGIPYQFMPHVDPRLDYSKAGSGAYLTDYDGTGREWAHHIASDMPILFISPGLPNFMTNFNEDEKNSIYSIIQRVAGNLGQAVSPDELLESSGKYYTFEYAVPDYYNYCNPACRIAAAYMGIATKQIDGTNLESLNWKDYTMKTLSDIFSNLGDVTSYASIPFYIESDTQISETFSNDVTDSSLTGMIDSISDIGREAMFILGYGNSALGANINALSNLDDVQSVKESIQSFFGSYAEGNGFISNVINHLTSVATGGKLIFPKIWSDSSFSRSYDVSIKLRSPDMDNFSIYCNVIVPFIHLLCLTLPRQISGNPNGFYSPFIVRALYKGFFNVDMGIISSMSVTKGDTGLWNADGIPCSIDVNLTITDLYDNISMTPTGWNSDNSLIQSLKYDTMDNTCFMDYIATLCGINIYQPEVGRTLRMWLVNNIANRASDIINIGLWGNIQNSIANAITNVWRHSSN